MKKKTLHVIVTATAVVLFLFFLAGYLILHGDKDAGKLEQIRAQDEPKAKTSVEKAESQEQDPQSAGPTSSGAESDVLSLAAAALSNSDKALRIQAVYSLRTKASPEAVALLSKFLDDQDRVVVETAIHVLGLIASENHLLKEPVYGILEEKARDSNFPQRGDALVMAAKVAEDSRILPIVSDYITEGNERHMDYAARALSFVPDQAASELLISLLEKSSSSTTLRNGARNLVEVDPHKAIDLLYDQSLSENAEKQLSLAWAIALKNNPDYNTVLVDGVASGRFTEKTMLTIARSPAAPEVFGNVLAAEDISKENKIAFLDVLARGGVRAPSAETRSAIADAVSPLLNSGDPDLEIGALKTLGQLGAGEKGEDIASKFQSKDVLIQRAALRAYAAYLNPQNYKTLQELYWDKDSTVRRTAFYLSEEFLNISDREVLEKAATHDDEEIRESAKAHLKNIPSD